MSARDGNLAAGRGVRPLEPALAAFSAQIEAAAAAGTALRIVGGDTKAFYGRACGGVPLVMTGYVGIVAYEPTELVVTVRAGTRLLDLEAALAEQGQMLGFEPPHCGDGSTIGGVVASGLSGPARPYLGSVRDFVLGIDVIDGQGQLLRFGGQVMKNVAGFDVARLLAGSLGTLGAIVQVSLRVVPQPRCWRTLVWPLSAIAARAHMLALARAPWPVTAMAFDGEHLRVRMAGSSEAVDHAVATLRPPQVADDQQYWCGLRDFQLPFFTAAPAPLWRLSLPPAAPEHNLDGARPPILYDWGGAQQWLKGHLDAVAVRRYAAALGGHATLMRAQPGVPMDEPFSAPAPPFRALMSRLKQTFDPAGLFNPGRMFAWL